MPDIACEPAYWGHAMVWNWRSSALAEGDAPGWPLRDVAQGRVHLINSTVFRNVPTIDRIRHCQRRIAAPEPRTDCRVPWPSVGLAHGAAWRVMEWYVPFQDGHAIVYHGHEAADDHSRCGPQVFCCPKAAQLLLQRYPDAIPADAEWEFADAELLASWMGPRGPTVYYFFFCDPRDKWVVRFSAVPGTQVRDVLFKRRALDEYLSVADRICRLGE